MRDRYAKIPSSHNVLFLPNHKTSAIPARDRYYGRFGCSRRSMKQTAGAVESIGSRTAGLLGAFAGFLRSLFGSFLLCRLFGDFLLRGLLHSFLSGLLGGFLCCFFRHNYSPGNRGLRTKHKQGCFVPW